VRKTAFEHIGNDFHVAMGVRSESATALHAIFIDHQQTPKADVGRVVVVGKGERMERVNPAVVRMTSVCGATNREHGAFPPCAFCP